MSYTVIDEHHLKDEKGAWYSTREAANIMNKKVAELTAARARIERLETEMRAVKKQIKSITLFLDRNPAGLNYQKGKRLVKMVEELYLVVYPETEQETEHAALTGSS